MNAERAAWRSSVYVGLFSRIPTAAVVVATAVVYVAAAKLGFRMASVAEQVTVVWPPTGIALAAVLLAGRRALGGVALGAFVANATTGEPPWTAALIAGGNTLEAFIGVGLLGAMGFRVPLARLRDVLALILGAATFSTMVSATVGVTALCLSGIQPWTAFGTLWGAWWTGDAIGALVVAPLLLTGAGLRRARPSLWSRLELLLLFGSVVLVSWLAFAGRIGSGAEPYPVHYAVFPLVIWAALRFGPAATAAVTAGASSIAIWGTVHGTGVFGTGTLHQRLLLLQLFMGVVATTGMLLAVAIVERDRAERETEVEYVREKVARLRADRARRQAEAARMELEAANRSKDQFLALVSHELRTPLSPIVAWAKLLRDGGLDQEESMQALETIERNANVQAHLIDDLLDVSRVASGKLGLELRPLDLATVVRAAVETVQPSAAAKDLRFQVTLEATGPVEGDAARLQQVVWNLLSNAVKFTPREGGIGVRLARLGTCAEITVSDSGCGIAPDDLPHVFERFWQSSSDSHRHKGLGLGLAIVRDLVELHGGTIAVESAGAGCGTVVRVALPLASAGAGTEALAAAPEGPEAVRLDGVRVLVVDDEPDTRDVVRRVLAGCGAEVRVASSAAQALEVLDRWLPGVLVSDIAMPDQDGYALIAQVRTRQPELGGNIPAIALTAFAGPGDRARILAAGFQAHAAKPVSPNELAVAVATLVRS